MFYELPTTNPNMYQRTYVKLKEIFNPKQRNKNRNIQTKGRTNINDTQTEANLESSPGNNLKNEFNSIPKMKRNVEIKRIKQDIYVYPVGITHPSIVKSVIKFPE